MHLGGNSTISSVQFSSVAQSCPTLCHPMNRSTPGLPVHHQLPEFIQTQCPSTWWCHPATSSSVVPFSSCSQSLPASESFPMSQLFAWDGRSIGVSASASFPPKSTQDQSPLEWTGWIYLQSKGLSRVFHTLVQKSESHWIGSLPLLQRIFPTQGSNPCLPHCRRILYQLSHKASASVFS